MKTTAAALGLTLLASPTFAATIDFGPLESDQAGDKFKLTLTAPTVAYGDAFFNFYAFGDLGGKKENVRVKLQGVNFGRVFNGKEDAFTVQELTNPDAVNEGAAPILREVLDDTATDDGFFMAQLRIAGDMFSDWVANGNGKLIVNLKFSGNVDYVTTGGNFTYNDIAPVPLPASLGLLGFGLAGFGALRLGRKKKAAAA